ncbi:hypothetical protein M0804_007360 [Polistes exclamans]|nr:hypothetical protein M0804_007360 [Polistes exclamans]
MFVERMLIGAPPAESFMWPDNGSGSTRACKSNEGNAIRDALFPTAGIQDITVIVGKGKEEKEEKEVEEEEVEEEVEKEEEEGIKIEIEKEGIEKEAPAESHRTIPVWFATSVGQQANGLGGSYLVFILQPYVPTSLHPNVPINQPPIQPFYPFPPFLFSRPVVDEEDSSLETARHPRICQ